MTNIAYRVENGKLIIEVDLSVDLGPSSTGNSNFVAKTGGWKKLDDVERGLSMNMNLTRVLPRSERPNAGTGNYSLQRRLKEEGKNFKLNKPGYWTPYNDEEL